MARITYPKALRLQAQKLRAAGTSYKDIAKQFGVVKSTARQWCKNIKLSDEAHQKLYKAGLIKMTTGPNNARNRRLREIDIIKTNAKNEITFPISDSAYKLLGAMLYWAEGNKTDNFGLTNSDPLLISFFIVWLQKAFNISPQQIKAHLNIYHQQDDAKLKSFWSELTTIPLVNFGKTFVKPLNKNYKQNTLYYGTIKLRIIKGSDFRHRLFAWMETLLAHEKIDLTKIETRWNKLKTDYGRYFPITLPKIKKIS